MCRLRPRARDDARPRTPKGPRVYYTQRVWSLYNSVGMCGFVGTPLNALALEQFASYVNSVTGWNMTLYEMMKVGERANTLARLFSCREGFTPADDVLSARMHEGIGSAALRGERVDPEQVSTARRLHYEMAGRDPDTGWPTAARRAGLDVDPCVFPAV